MSDDEGNLEELDIPEEDVDEDELEEEEDVEEDELSEYGGEESVNDDDETVDELLQTEEEIVNPYQLKFTEENKNKYLLFFQRINHNNLHKNCWLKDIFLKLFLSQ